MRFICSACCIFKLSLVGVNTDETTILFDVRSNMYLQGNFVIYTVRMSLHPHVHLL